VRKPVHFTFGNHMHWVDMQWLWGYEVLPGSVRDMLHLCRETGIKGNVNFDAIGYEKMAAECPEALGELREAIAQGTVEPVGCSYGQPYGLFNGGESNIRQLTYGVRSTRRLLGVRPRAFWEEEFYFFPQLPQMLRQCGYTGACLFFQWTWHTPEVPREPHALVLWEGIDGSQLPALPRNELNLHQWPEDFGPLFESALLRDLDQPAIVQWVELMPSKDWMCRSEVLLPKLKELIANPEFEIVPGTLSEVIAKIGSADAPVRRYTMDDVWHGMTLGKNGDKHPRTSRAAEHAILAAESLAATASLLGRPYAQWDVYPTWEIDEAWRELLAAQHHDNHECEGLCGFVGYEQFTRARSMADRIAERAAAIIGARIAGPPAPVLTNQLAWPVPLRYPPGGEASGLRLADGVPPFGFALPHTRATRPRPVAEVQEIDDTMLRLHRGALQVDIDQNRGMITQIRSETFPGGILRVDVPLLSFQRVINGRADRFTQSIVRVDGESAQPRRQCVGIYRTSDHEPGAAIDIVVSLHDTLDAVLIEVMDQSGRPDPGYAGALRSAIALGFAHSLAADTAGAVRVIDPSGSFQRKYPEGDWMTSPQWFETIERPFTAQHFVAFRDATESSSRGVAYVHDGAQQFSRSDDGAEHVLKVYDPWDEDRDEAWSGDMQMLIWPFARASHAELMRVAWEHNYSHTNKCNRVYGLCEIETAGSSQGDVPPVFGPLCVEGAPGVLASAFFRESSKSGEHLPDWAGHDMVRRSEGACTHPFVIRLVEYNGEPAEVTLKLVGPVASAAKTNLMGEVGAHVAAGEDTCWLDVTPAEPPEWAIDPNTGQCYEFRGQPLEWSQVTFRMRPREIATVYADMVMGRKEYRDLDAKRKIWATVHRTKGETAGD